MIPMLSADHELIVISGLNLGQSHGDSQTTDPDPIQMLFFVVFSLVAAAQY